MKIDAIFEHIGDFGRYHQILYAVVFIAGIPNALILLHFVFSHFEPDFHCAIAPEFLRDSENATNWGFEDILNYTIPMEVDVVGELTRSKCHMYERNYSSLALGMKDDENATIGSCKYGYTFDLAEGQNSAVVEFSMVCDKALLAPLVASLTQAGIAVGSVTSGIGDRFGRRPTFLWFSAAQVVMTIFASLSWNYYSYVIAMFFVGCVQLVSYVMAFVLVAEVTAIRWRNFIAVSSFISFSVGYCIDPALGYLFPNWRHFLYAIATLTAVCYIPCYWLFPESPRWLIIKGRTDEGIKELKKMTRMNKSNLNFEAFVEENLLEDEIEKERRKFSALKTLKVLFKSGITPRCLSVFFLWLVTSLAYFAISIYSTTFSENRFLNMLFAGLCEFPSYVVSYYAVRFIGRPRSAFWFAIIFGTCSIVLPFMPASGLSVLKTIVSMIGKGAISANFYVAFFLMAEIPPTLHRTSGMSVASFSARIGSFCAPFLMFLGKEYPFLPNLVMGVAAITSGILCIAYVPETKGVPLPDTIEEAENNRRYYGLRIFRNLAPTELPLSGERKAIAI